MTIFKKLFCFSVSLIFEASSLFSQGHSPHSELLSQNEISDLLNDSVTKAFNLDIPVYRIYKYSDKSGNYFNILSELKGPYTIATDTPNIRVVALNLQMSNGKITKTWNLEKEVLPDYIVGVQNISFLEDYIEFKDLDNDSIIEPIIVYNTLTELSLLIIYKNQIVSIEYQFQGYDFETLRVDKSYYELPQIVKSYVEGKLHSLEKSMNIALPDKWQIKMKNHKTLIRASKNSR